MNDVEFPLDALNSYISERLGKYKNPVANAHRSGLEFGARWMFERMKKELAEAKARDEDALKNSQFASAHNYEVAVNLETECIELRRELAELKAKLFRLENQAVCYEQRSIIDIIKDLDGLACVNFSEGPTEADWHRVMKCNRELVNKLKSQPRGDVNGLVMAVKKAKERCVCTRSTYGFDYSEDHPKVGRPGIGKRWLTPNDILSAALKAYESQGAPG